MHWLADVHLAGFAPAFTLSFHDSERSRKPQVRIASVVMGHFKKKQMVTKLNKIEEFNIKLTKEEKVWELRQDQKGLQHQQENQTNVNETTKVPQVILLH